MEGKGVLFKRFADVDVFDIELDSKDPDEVIRVVKAIAPTFGGINLEDIKAPECFYIEEKLREMLDIPVFHDDQHGTAIITGAALLNGLELTGKKIEDLRLVVTGAGAAALSTVKFYVELGIQRQNIIMCDEYGVVYAGREIAMDPYKAKFAAQTKLRTLSEALRGADMFLGLSVGNIVTAEMVKSMAAKPMRSATKRHVKRGQMPSWRRAAATIRTRSTMYWAFRLSFVERWTFGPGRSTKR